MKRYSVCLLGYITAVSWMLVTPPGCDAKVDLKLIYPPNGAVLSKNAEPPVFKWTPQIDLKGNKTYASLDFRVIRGDCASKFDGWELPAHTKPTLASQTEQGMKSLAKQEELWWEDQAQTKLREIVAADMESWNCGEYRKGDPLRPGEYRWDKFWSFLPSGTYTWVVFYEEVSSVDGAATGYAIMRASTFRITDDGTSGGPGAGTVTVNPVDEAHMVYVPGGPYRMGCDNCGINQSGPEHVVQVRGFCIYKYEVTVAQYRRFCNATGRSMPSAPAWGWQDEHPIVNVSWGDASAYAKWAGGRLPTEAEWEKAARGTDARQYPWGNEWNPQNCVANRTTTARVGSCPGGVSPYGCEDMSGNVNEWCSDYSSESYMSQMPDGGWVDPAGPSSGQLRVCRSTGFEASDYGLTCRSGFSPNARYPHTGFRVVLPSPPQQVAPVVQPTPALAPEPAAGQLEAAKPDAQLTPLSAPKLILPEGDLIVDYSHLPALRWSTVPGASYYTLWMGVAGRTGTTGIEKPKVVSKRESSIQPPYETSRHREPVMIGLVRSEDVPGGAATASFDMKAQHESVYSDRPTMPISLLKQNFGPEFEQHEGTTVFYWGVVAEREGPAGSHEWSASECRRLGIGKTSMPRSETPRAGYADDVEEHDISGKTDWYDYKGKTVISLDSSGKQKRVTRLSFSNFNTSKLPRRGEYQGLPHCYGIPIKLKGVRSRDEIHLTIDPLPPVGTTVFRIEVEAKPIFGSLDFPLGVNVGVEFDLKKLDIKSQNPGRNPAVWDAASGAWRGYAEWFKKVTDDPEEIGKEIARRIQTGEDLDLEATYQGGDPLEITIAVKNLGSKGGLVAIQSADFEVSVIVADIAYMGIKEITGQVASTLRDDLVRMGAIELLKAAARALPE